MPCWLLEGTRIRLGSCVKQGRKLERESGDWGESGKYESIFFGIRTPFRTLYHPSHFLLSLLNPKISKLWNQRLPSSSPCFIHFGHYTSQCIYGQKRPTKQIKPSRFRSGFFKGRIRKVLHVNIFCYILLHFCRFHAFGQENRKGVFL